MVAFESDISSDQANWLDGLSSHAIFSPSSSRLGRQCMVVRNSDLIVASDKSLRMTSLLEVKHKINTSSSSKNSGTFKELVSDALDFDIAEIILNPSGKLVAVVGSHKIVVVVLPRPGIYSSKSVGSKVAVKAAIVGSFYYHERIGGRARLASVKWHPWGHLGSSLLVMSKDGLLREFDVSDDVQEPVQTVSLLPSSPKQADLSSSFANQKLRGSNLRSRSRSQTPSVHRSIRSTSRIALDDDDNNLEEDYIADTSASQSRSGNGPAAVTFTFGIDARNSEDEGEDKSAKLADWKPLSIYTLCTNGDIYALCPFMPKNASMPFSYISSLSSLVSQNSSSPDRLNVDIQNRYIASLLKQARTSRKEHLQSPSPTTKSRRSFSATPMSLDPRASAAPEESVAEEANNEFVLLQAPPATMVPRQPQPQGPFLLWPAPIELSEDRENVSTDLFFARAESGQNSLDILGILGNDGRVDLCLLLEAIEPHWGQNLQPSLVKKRIVSSGRYALSDSDDDDDDQNDAMRAAQVKPLPTLFVYETIDLVSSEYPPPNCNAQPCFVLDPLYSDTIYVYHSTGAHAIGFGRWSKDLLGTMALSEEERPIAMERILHTATPSDVIRVLDSTGSSHDSAVNDVIGLCIISDIYLSYSFLALMHSGSFVALELGLRVEESEDYDVVLNQRTPLVDLQPGSTPYTSLLGDGPIFVPPEPFKTVNGLPYHPRSAIKGRHSSQELVVTIETLRSLATVVSTLRGEMRKIVQGGNVVQSRLELQIKEINRQLSKLNETRSRLDQGRLRQERLDQRINRVLEKQNSLVKKSDWLLQKLVENHSPEVSIYEIKWFKELERLEEDVGGKKKDSDEAQGLNARVKKLQYQLEIIRPDLIKMKKESRAKEASEMMGAKQLQSVESMLAKEAQLLNTNRNKILHLQSRMQRHSMY